MRKLLNTLYVTNPKSYLYKDGQNLVISIDQTEIFRIPVINIENIVTFGYMGASPGLMSLCTENGIGLCFMTPQGRFISRISGPQRGNVTLRMKQYAVNGDSNFATALSKLFIMGKVHNCRQVLLRHIRDYGSNPLIEDAQNILLSTKQAIARETDASALMGHEGRAASTYFGVFNRLILQSSSVFKFEGRNRRPPKDPVNALLSFTYHLLTHEMISALESVGLDPYVGFLHKLRPGRPSLALDMIEELRAPICDRLVLSLINKKQITEKHFQFPAENIVNITDEGRKVLLTAWQNRKREEILHPYLQEKIERGLLPYTQSMLLARYLRNDLDNYPVYLIK